MRRARGFTLLEVMVSLAILAVSLVAILNLHSGAVRMHNHAKHLTVASLLARGKMAEVEVRLHDEDEGGFPTSNEVWEGSFEEEGYPNFTWEAEILKPELEIGPDDVTGMVDSLVPANEDGGPVSDTGSTQQMATQLLGQLGPLVEEGIREVRLTVRWSDITGPSDLSVATHVVKPPAMPGLPGNPAPNTPPAADGGSK